MVWSRPDGKLDRLAALPALRRLRRPQLLVLGSIVDELTFPPGRVIVRGGILPSECFILFRSGDGLLSERGAWRVPEGGATLGVWPWLTRDRHPATVLAATTVIAYSVSPPAVHLLVETVGLRCWPSAEWPR